jgi:hypothetical protein
MSGTEKFGLITAIMGMGYIIVYTIQNNNVGVVASFCIFMFGALLFFINPNL